MAAKEELRDFLRSRRARLTPADVGLPVTPGVRRVPGLRREEIAQLANLSVDYYMRLEQGRDINVSEDVLKAVADVLRLREDERTHLYDLARPIQSRRKPRPQPHRVRPGILALVQTLPTPAFVVDQRLDVLATNQIARALLFNFDAHPRPERNHARWVFLDPQARERYLDWEEVARDCVATLRMHAGRHPDDLELAALVGELTVKSPEFSRWWAITRCWYAVTEASATTTPPSASSLSPTRHCPSPTPATKPSSSTPSSPAAPRNKHSSSSPAGPSRHQHEPGNVVDRRALVLLSPIRVRQVVPSWRAIPATLACSRRS